MYVYDDRIENNILLYDGHNETCHVYVLLLQQLLPHYNTISIITDTIIIIVTLSFIILTFHHNRYHLNLHH